MSSAWFALPASFLLMGQDQAPTVEQIDDKLVVEWKRKRIQANPRVVTFSEGVIARYGPTVVRADTLTLYLDETEKRGVAEGNVHVDDPEGTVDAANLEFNWNNGTGSAKNVAVVSGRIHVNAATINIKPEEWVLTDAYGTPCHESPPSFALKATKVTIRPGVRGVAEQAEFYVLGKKIIKLPKYSFSLQKRAAGFRLPSLSYRAGAGVGVAWNSAFQFSGSTALNTGFRVFPKDKPSANLELAQSLIPYSEASGIIVPRSDLDEPFSFGYFENVFIRNPREERDYIGARRTNVSVGAAWNVGASARRTETLFTKPWEIAFEDGRSLGDMRLTSQLRYQSIREERGPTESRGIAYMSANMPPIAFSEQLYTNIRFDGTGYLNQGSNYGWGRAQFGLVYRPNERFRLGAAFNTTAEFGTARFQADRPYAMQTLHLRGDFDLGSTQISWLSKYDIKGKRWYDHELGLVQVAGCFEPFVVLRRFPRTTSFGIRIRANDLFDALRQRTQKRRTEKVKVPDY